MPKWLQYYIGGGGGSLQTPKSDYVICARPHIRDIWTINWKRKWTTTEILIWTINQDAPWPRQPKTRNKAYSLVNLGVHRGADSQSRGQMRNSRDCFFGQLIRTCLEVYKIDNIENIDNMQLITRGCGSDSDKARTIFFRKCYCRMFA